MEVGETVSNLVWQGGICDGKKTMSTKHETSSIAIPVIGLLNSSVIT